jgi:hypothetical protein
MSPTGGVTPLKLLQTCLPQEGSLLLMKITTNISPTGEVTLLIRPDFNYKLLQTCLPQEGSLLLM